MIWKTKKQGIRFFAMTFVRTFFANVAMLLGIYADIVKKILCIHFFLGKYDTTCFFSSLNVGDLDGCITTHNARGL